MSSSAYDAKKAAEDKKRQLQAEAKKKAKLEKDSQKAERQQQRLKDIKAKSEAGKAAAKKKEEEKLKSMSPAEIQKIREQEERELAYLEKLRIAQEDEGLRRKAIQQTLASQQGEESLFKAKLSKEERKAQQAAKRAAKAAAKKEKSEGGESDEDAAAARDLPPPPPGSAAAAKKRDPLSKVDKERSEVEFELEQAILTAARSRREMGAYKGHIEARSFTLPNPGGGANLLEEASCILARGHIYGLIGRNGKGKSTMLRALAARRVGDVPANVSVHYVSQEVQLTERTKKMTPAECVVEADVERKILMQEASELEARADGGAYSEEDQKRHAECLEKLELISADTAERRAEELIVNLGFPEELRQRPLSALSGGWRVRTMLAAAIFARPDLLLLDEPTNHLSIGAVLWLSRELATNPVWKERIVVIVSHDRTFLDDVCSDCLHISGAARKLTQSKGNYSLWAKRRAEMKKVYDKQTELRNEKMAKLNDMADCGFRYGGSSSAIGKKKQAEKQSDKLAEEALASKEEAAALQEDIELPLALIAGGELPGFVVNLKNVGFGYPECPELFTGCEFGITSKSRVVLLGENGNGKTTLLKLIKGDLEPTSGEVKLNPGARVALVNQHHADQIDLDQTPLQYMESLFKAKPGVTGYDHLQGLRSHLSKCGVTSGSDSKDGSEVVLEMQTTPAKALSGGQRSRVAMAAVSYREPHLLLLDEPTNNLDLESVSALAESVCAFKGAVVCVSHDQYFVEKISNEAWLVGGKSKQVREIESFGWYKNSQLKKLGRPVEELKKKDGAPSAKKKEPLPAPKKPATKKYSAPKMGTGGINLKSMASRGGAKKPFSNSATRAAMAPKAETLRRGRFDNLGGGGGFEWTAAPLGKK